MSDDLEYLDGHTEPESLGPCWSCQKTVNAENCVRISQHSLPVCLACWDSIPSGQRLLIAQKIHSAERFGVVADSLQEVLSRAIAESNFPFYGRN